MSQTILIVDDDEVDRQAVRRALNSGDADYGIREAASAEAAFDVLEREIVDCTLLDYRLPDTDGIDLLQRLRNHPILNEMPVVMLTGMGDERLAVRTIQAGAQDYMVKEDISPGALRRAVQAAVDRARLEAEYRHTVAELEVTNTQLLESNRALLESEVRFRVAFDTAPHGMAIIDLEGRWVQVNEAYCKMLGYTEPELLHKDFESVRHPDDAAEAFDYLKKMISGEITSFQKERRFVRKDGTDVFAIVSASLVKNETGQPLHFISQAADLTEAHEVQEQLDRAQRLDAIGQLTGGVAHDFNNLLMALRINLEMLSDREKSDPLSAELVEASIGSVDRGAQLTGQLLSFARRQVLVPEKVDLQEMLEDFLSLLRRTLGEQISIEPHVDDDLWPTEVDIGQLENAILNLALNARDAMEDGGSLIIEASNTSLDDEYTRHYEDVKPGDYICLSLSDTGRGMPESVVDRAFEPFFTTKEMERGTGLGLSMVYGFVKQSQGHISIYSEEGEGTTVKLFLPRASGDVPESRTTTTRSTIVKGHESILVVEDDPDVRVTVRSLLMSLGYDVRAVTDGPEALGLLDSGQFVPQLALLDVILPRGMNGREVREAIQQRLPDCRMLFMSGYTKDVVTHQGRLDDDIVLLSKPFPKAELSARLRELLDGDG
ncbi:MAG: response regulator [Alphaproteobacteria bacterium]